MQKTENFIPTIGLEIHIQLKTKSKMFCGCDNKAEGKAPNSVVCPVCLGMPGTLPVANKQAIEWTVKLGKYLGGNIEPLTKFDRKHYFYPDLPKGYQISQYDHPIVRGGEINISGRAIELTRIHLEEDAGKLVHPKGKDYSLVDLNRAGTPLMEVVTEPVIKSPAEAKAFLQRLRLVVRYLGITDADMEKGHFRCDANVSIAKIQTLGTPVEVKNLNSFLMVEKALAYEIKRQTEILARGEKVSKETRGWDDAKGVTVGQRSKESAPDYRYFPEPDLPAMLELDKEFDIALPESIDDKIARAQELGLSEGDIDTIFSDHNLVATFDSVTRQETENKVAQKAVSIIINFSSARRLSGEKLVELAELSSAGAIGPQSIRPLINEVLEEGVSIEQAVRDGGFAQESDRDKIRESARRVIADHQAAVNDYRSGKKTAAGYLVGQIMKASKGKANPHMVNEILNEELK